MTGDHLEPRGGGGVPSHLPLSALTPPPAGILFSKDFTWWRGKDQRLNFRYIFGFLIENGHGDFFSSMSFCSDHISQN